MNLKLGQSFTMCSSNFPKKYPKNQRCVVDVEAPQSTWLRITFCYFNVMYSHMCKGDRFVVLDRAMAASSADPPCDNKYQRVRRFCNIQTRRVYYVKTPNARFKFQTNKDKYIRKGFKVQIQAIQSPCHLEMMPPRGVIRVAHMKGARYHSNYYCNWVYNYGHTENEALHITCPSFYVHEGVKYMKSSPDCVHITSTQGEETSFTGKTGPEYVSHGGNVTFEFFANRRHHSQGFTCQYHVNPPGGVGGLCIHEKNCNGSRLECVNKICDCLSNYTKVTLPGGNETCASTIKVGDSGCVADVDCNLHDANAYCNSGTCDCKTGYEPFLGVCHKHRGLNEACTDSTQCQLTKNAGVCTGGVCKCNSGFSTVDARCGGGKYTGCYPIVIVPRGLRSKSFTMPVAHNAKFCVYNFAAGVLQFSTGTKSIKYEWKRSVGRNNLRVYRRLGAWKMAHIRTNSIRGNPDFFTLARINPTFLQLQTGTGGTISHNVKVYPPVKWATFYLWTRGTNLHRSVVFVEPN